MEMWKWLVFFAKCHLFSFEMFNIVRIYSNKILSSKTMHLFRYKKNRNVTLMRELKLSKLVKLVMDANAPILSHVLDYTRRVTSDQSTIVPSFVIFQTNKHSIISIQ